MCEGRHGQAATATKVAFAEFIAKKTEVNLRTFGWQLSSSSSQTGFRGRMDSESSDEDGTGLAYATEADVSRLIDDVSCELQSSGWVTNTLSGDSLLPKEEKKGSLPTSSTWTGESADLTADDMGESVSLDDDDQPDPSSSLDSLAAVLSYDLADQLIPAGSDDEHDNAMIRHRTLMSEPATTGARREPAQVRTSFMATARSLIKKKKPAENQFAGDQLDGLVPTHQQAPKRADKTGRPSVLSMLRWKSSKVQPTMDA